jgi:hypothetical protein
MSVTVVHMTISKYHYASHPCYRTFFIRRNNTSIRQEACLFTLPIKGMSQSLVSNQYDPLLEERELFSINKGSMWVIAVARMTRGEVPCSICNMTRQGGFRTQEAGPPDQARRSFKF